MEPDLYVLAGAPAGVSGTYAGDHIVGPSQGEGGGERIPGRGEKTKPKPSQRHSVTVSQLILLNGVKPLRKLLAIIKCWVVQSLPIMDQERSFFLFACEWQKGLFWGFTFSVKASMFYFALIPSVRKKICELKTFGVRPFFFFKERKFTWAFYFCQILIELETALLDDEPHWYKLQTHDVSSIPLPRASPNAQRRQLHGESPTRRLQSE